jgi:hypothetical protein
VPQNSGKISQEVKGGEESRGERKRHREKVKGIWLWKLFFQHTLRRERRR